MAKILVAEDDELTRYLLRLSLEQDNHTVIDAKNGREAIQQLVTEQPRVVLLDLMMPGIDGAEVIKTVRSQPELENIKIIVVTGLAQPETIPETEQADLILRKPIPIPDLIAHVNKFLT